MVDVELASEYRKIDRDRFQGLFDILREEASDEDWARRTIKKMVAYLKGVKDCSASPPAKHRLTGTGRVVYGGVGQN